MKQEEYTIDNKNKQGLNRLRDIQKYAANNRILILISICSVVIVILVILFTVLSIQDERALNSACETFCGVSAVQKVTTYSASYCSCSGDSIECSQVSDAAQIEDDVYSMSVSIKELEERLC
ncbi:Leucine rich repeat [Popillia japonica]|uniref:Leucine rich repeat n=1 Tax=Popillia japonica TaxID=7064 RepID=A0AAW1KIE3_POPJA